MVIRSSSARDVERLVTELREGTSAEREAAVARLRILGDRAIARVADLLASDAPVAVRVAAICVLEGVDDPRARQAVLSASEDGDPQVAAAGGAALRQHTEPTASLDLLEDPLAVRGWLAAHHTAPLSALHEFITRARERERQEHAAPRRQNWLVARGTMHAALARRGSTIALYDLKETFEAATGALPLDFLAAASAIGDGTCLEPMGRAWTAAVGDAWWRDHLVDAATSIMRRSRLNGRSGVIKRIRLKHPGFV